MMSDFASLPDDLVRDRVLPYCDARAQRRLAALGRRWRAALSLAGALSLCVDGASGGAALAWLASADLGRLKALELRFEVGANRDPALADAALAVLAAERCPALRPGCRPRKSTGENHLHFTVNPNVVSFAQRRSLSAPPRPPCKGRAHDAPAAVGDGRAIRPPCGAARRPS